MGICPFFANVSGTSTKIETETVSCRQMGCQVWDSIANECALKLAGRYMRHFHYAHQHNIPHIPADLSVIGGPTIKTSLPYATALVQEFACFEDVDGNGKVYGLDFKLVMDNTIPPALRGIQRNPDFNQNVPEVKWLDLFAWKQGEGPDPLLIEE